MPPDNFENMAMLLMELQSHGYPPKEITGELPEGRTFVYSPHPSSYQRILMSPLKIPLFQDCPLMRRRAFQVSVSYQPLTPVPLCNSNHQFRESPMQ